MHLGYWESWRPSVCKKISIGEIFLINVIWNTVSKVTITPEKTIPQLRVAIAQVYKPPELPQPPNVVHVYLEIKTDDAELIENAELEFRVKKTWVKRNHIDKTTIRLFRYEEKWVPLPTEIVREDGDYLYCSAKTKGFSTFAVTGEVVPEPLPWYLIAVGIAIVVLLIAVVLFKKRKPSLETLP